MQIKLEDRLPFLFDFGELLKGCEARPAPIYSPLALRDPSRPFSHCPHRSSFISTYHVNGVKAKVGHFDIALYVP
jgi:hypothetical protein